MFFRTLCSSVHRLKGLIFGPIDPLLGPKSYGRRKILKIIKSVKQSLFHASISFISQLDSHFAEKGVKNNFDTYFLYIYMRKSC